MAHNLRIDLESLQHAHQMRWNNSGIASLRCNLEALPGERGRVGQSKGQSRPAATWLHAQKLGRFDRMAAT